MMQEPLIEIKNLTVTFTRPQKFAAVKNVNLIVYKGETLALVGESGSGKTTLGRAVLGLYPEYTRGEIIFAGQNILAPSRYRDLVWRQNMQMIFQDPVESLNSRMSVGAILDEPFLIHRKFSKADRRAKVLALLDIVGLHHTAIDKYPHEFSGGQRQRIGIARAIALRPQLIVCDEPVSALDVSIQAQILNLLLELQRELGLTYIFIAHGMPVVHHMADRVAVMRRGEIVEMEKAARLFKNPQHEYTKELLSVVPPLLRE